MSDFTPTPNEVAGKVVLVAGAASGIGEAIAEVLHARGAKVIAEDIDPSVESLARAGMVPFVADITQDGAAEQAVALAVQEFGKLDVLVNNAGRILYKPLLELTRKEWQWQMETNVTGAFLHSREAVKQMTKQKSGAIVNIASYYAFPCISAYIASMGALAQMTRTLALEVIKHGIHVNAIGVGNVVTNLLNRFMDDGRGFLAAGPGRNCRGRRLPRF